MRASKWLAVTCTLAALGACGDDDATGPSRDGADAGAPVDAGHDAGQEGDDAIAMAAVWAADWIRAYDRQIAASCPCLVGADAFASLEDCTAALGSGPTWSECAVEAVTKADAGAALDAAHARCLIDSLDARASCLEQAGCDADAMTTCLSMPDRPDECPALDSELVVLLLEQCPDLGLLSR